MKNSNIVLLSAVTLAVAFLVSVVYYSKQNEVKPTLPIAVEEFSDFQCPACKANEPFVAQMKTEFGDKIKFTYKHFPLDQHDRAYEASVASEAARKQGKFDQYHDKLFEMQAEFKDEDFFKYAQDLGLDVEKFKKDYGEDASLKALVDKDMKEGQDRGVTSTPTFFINGKKRSGVKSENMLQEIRDSIKKAETPN